MGVQDSIGGSSLHLPDDIPANQYVTFKGGKASASRGVGLTITEGLEKYQPDALRYALAANFPEQADTEISNDEITRRINEELVANWGNLVNRVLAMTYKNAEQAIPSSGELTEDDDKLLQLVDSALETAASQFDQVELRAALRTAMEAAKETNKYLNATEPWKVVKEDHLRGLTILFVALSAINGIRVMFAPFLPFSTQELNLILGETKGWIRQDLNPGTPLAKPKPLFRKVE
jgi:methionyl-tRNA synthetase